ncbi:MAG: RuvX/YqgF family protein [Oscillospiraceae bacterium]|nr:RuvX/YqgF family protein [Oscillospiraceae bacterium]
MRIMAVDYGDARTGIAVSDVSAAIVGDAFVIHSKNAPETTRKIADEAISRNVSCVVVGHPKNMDGSRGRRAEKSEALAHSLRQIFDAALSPNGAAHAKNRETAPTAAHSAGETKSTKDIEVKLWDERLTTKSANVILTNVGKYGRRRKNTVDAVAASLILESYLASRRF